ncbi:MAG TPA: cyclic pyranopterin monophosphate synthase MoaC [Actinomycetota bacterium]|nr:cyclic pyranopterin monophosphate synthase MoaC [Actinomycetota bacterium]
MTDSGITSHLDESGSIHMVDVSTKDTTVRVASATAFVRMSPDGLELLREGRLAKGDALTTAKLAGIMAAKKTHDLIPLCHPLSLSSIDVVCEIADSGVKVTTEVRTVERTGVEMEALVAASIAALTIYDMCKSVDRAMVVEEVMLLSKSGGRSGAWRRPTD